MERRHFLQFAVALVVGTAALAGSVRAAPLAPQSVTTGDELSRDGSDAHPAVTSAAEVDRLKPEQVRWGHGHHWGWHHRHWGWHHRHWGWHRRWHHWHHWHHRHWRRW